MPEVLKLAAAAPFTVPVLALTHFDVASEADELNSPSPSSKLELWGKEEIWENEKENKSENINVKR